MAANITTAGAYKSTYRLIQEMCGVSDHVPVKWRRWLWEKTLDVATDLIALIVYAWDEQNVAHKVVYIDRALTKFTVLNTYMRLCNENAILPLQKQTTLSELMANISGQLGSWRKATAERAKRGVRE
nr:MAG TPA: Avd-like protein [Caudoviricetes sp.]